MKREDFLARVRAAGHLETSEEAERWSSVVVIALSQLLGDSALRRHFVSELPGFLKSRVLEEPLHPLAMDCQAFVQHVASALGTHAPEAQRAIRAVYGVLKAAVSPGHVAELKTHVPRDIAAFLERQTLTALR